MATFYANPNDETEPWIETAAIKGYDFRIWHLIFFCFAGALTLLILICCCIKIRIPRTKQEIESDFRRKKLTKKFQERLKLIHNQDMDAIDLQQALHIIQEDYEKEKQNINEGNEIGFPPKTDSKNQKEDMTPLAMEERRPSRLSKKFANVLIATALKTQGTTE